jgi:hypothetical protein
VWRDERGLEFIHRNTLYERFEAMRRFKVECNGGWYNLTIINVTVADAGDYECSEDGYDIKLGRVKVKVLGEHLRSLQSWIFVACSMS